MNERVEARYQLKDENGDAILDEDGKATYVSVEVDYDFGDDLDGAVELCGPEVVFSNFKANARVALQSILRAKKKAGLSDEQIQNVVNNWKPGMVAERTTVDPETAVADAFENWPEEKKRAFLAKLGIEV